MTKITGATAPDGSRYSTLTNGNGGVIGSYSVAATSGTMAAGLASGSPIFSFRYGGTGLCLVRKIVFSAGDIVAFAAGALIFQTFVARAFSASDTGGTASTLTTNNGKLRTSFATTAVSDFRISSTATLSAGTRTLDAAPIGSTSHTTALVIGNDLLTDTYLFRVGVGEEPLQLATNEGFVIQATVPGTGTWNFSVQVLWDEVISY